MLRNKVNWIFVLVTFCLASCCFGLSGTKKGRTEEFCRITIPVSNNLFIDEQTSMDKYIYLRFDISSDSLDPFLLNTLFVGNISKQNKQFDFRTSSYYFESPIKRFKPDLEAEFYVAVARDTRWESTLIVEMLHNDSVRIHIETMNW